MDVGVSKMYAVNQGCISLPISWSVAAIMRVSATVVVVVVVVRTRPKANRLP